MSVENSNFLDTLAKWLRSSPALMFLLGAVAFTLIRYFITVPADINVLRNEEVSIYLHAAEKSFLDFFMMPDSNYINFISKFCAFVCLRVLKAFDSFALVQNVVNWFAAACFSILFLTRRFSRLIPSFGLRLALCVYLYLLPIYDMYMVFSQGYYIFFGLLYCLILLSDEEPPNRAEILFVVLAGPFVVFGKPVFFVFGFAYLALFAIQGRNYMREGMRARRLPSAHFGLLVYLLVLYAFQAWFTLAHKSYMAGYATDAVGVAGGLAANAAFFLKKGLIFFGYGLVCPVAHVVRAKLATTLCIMAGTGVALLFCLNVRTALRQRSHLWLALLVLLGAGSALCVYGALKVDFLYQRFFVQDIFAMQWSQRMIFPVVLFGVFNVAFFVQGMRQEVAMGYLVYLVLLCLASCIVPAWNTWNTGYRPSFTWHQTRPLLDARYPFIPHAYGIEFYYTRGLTFVSAEAPVTVETRDTLGASGIPAGHKVMYILLKQTPGVDAFALAPSAMLVVTIEGVEQRASLVNPGENDQYLFKFASFVPSEAFARFRLEAAGLNLAGKSLSCYAIGF